MVVLPKEVAQQVLKALTLGGAMYPNGGTARDQIDVAMSALRQAIAAKQQATDAIACGAPHHGIDQSEVYDPKTGIYRWIDDGTRMRPGEQCSGRTRQTAGESTAPANTAVPCACCGEGKVHISVTRVCDTCGSEYAGREEMDAAKRIEAEQQAEPVAWRAYCDKYGETYWDQRSDATLHDAEEDPDPLYLHPQPAQQPLTDERQDAARYRWLRDALVGGDPFGSLNAAFGHLDPEHIPTASEFDGGIDFAIERAHGIK